MQMMMKTKIQMRWKRSLRLPSRPLPVCQCRLVRLSLRPLNCRTTKTRHIRHRNTQLVVQAKSHLRCQPNLAWPFPFIRLWHPTTQHLYSVLALTEGCPWLHLQSPFLIHGKARVDSTPPRPTLIIAFTMATMVQGCPYRAQLLLVISLTWMKTKLPVNYWNSYAHAQALLLEIWLFAFWLLTSGSPPAEILCSFTTKFTYATWIARKRKVTRTTLPTATASRQCTPANVVWIWL